MNNLHIDSRIPGSNAITLHLSALTVERLATADPVLAQFKADGFDHQKPYLRFLPALPVPLPRHRGRDLHSRPRCLARPRRASLRGRAS